MNKTPTNGKQKPKGDEALNPFKWSFMKGFILDIIDLRKGVDKLATIAEIKSRKSMSGANAWMLMCSIIIASIGLDRDSDAVIIGAMLISPLMSPILGIGLGIGVNDKEVVKQSFVHFFAAIVIALLTSYIYFSFTPFGQVTPSIASRTEPLTLDVLVAIFGGLAGIISIARKDLSTTLPGVAIATALMPPLCVTGFGLATHNWSYALNSFYLFLLNTSFITLSTYIIVRFLKFPYRRYLNPVERFRNRVVVVLFSLLMVIPSFFILRDVLDSVKVQQQIEVFIDQAFGLENPYLDGFKVDIVSDSTSTLLLKVYGDSINQSKIPVYLEKMKNVGLENWDITILESSEVNLDDLSSLRSKIDNIELLNKRERQRQAELMALKASTIDSSEISQICQDFKILYPEVISISYAESMLMQTGPIAIELPTLLIELDQKKKLDEERRQAIPKYFRQKFKVDTIRVVFN